jgi:TRAP-type mannitol/chloroaromatic compound transport system permease large subunit
VEEVPARHLGTIFVGLATPTEAGALGVVVGAIALAASYGTLTWPLLYQGMSTTMRGFTCFTSAHVVVGLVRQNCARSRGPITETGPRSRL